MFESASEAACAPRTRSVRWSMSRAGSMLYTIAHLPRTEGLAGGTVHVHTILEPSVQPPAAVAQGRTSCPDQTYVPGAARRRIGSRISIGISALTAARSAHWVGCLKFQLPAQRSACEQLGRAAKTVLHEPGPRACVLTQAQGATSPSTPARTALAVRGHRRGRRTFVVTDASVLSRPAARPAAAQPRR